jgi:hypothetical protein
MRQLEFIHRLPTKIFFLSYCGNFAFLHILLLFPIWLPENRGEGVPLTFELVLGFVIEYIVGCVVFFITSTRRPFQYESLDAHKSEIRLFKVESVVTILGSGRSGLVEADLIPVPSDSTAPVTAVSYTWTHSGNLHILVGRKEALMSSSVCDLLYVLVDNPAERTFSVSGLTAPA